MTQHALHLESSAVHQEFDFIIYSSERGLISEHLIENEARAAFESLIADVELGDYLPLLLRRHGEDWDFA
jgi:hypothetical protein